MVYGGVDEVRRRYSLPEIRVHARGPIPAIAAVARVTEEGDGHLPPAARRRHAAARSAGRARRARGSRRAVRAAAGADGRHLRSRGAGGTGMSGWQKIKTVATFEFLSTVKRPGYLIATFGMPLFMAAYAGVIAIPAYFAEKSGRQPAVHGVVDQAGVLRLEGDLDGRRWFARARGDAPGARSGRPGGGARSGRRVGELRVPAVRDRRGGPRRARRAPAEGLLRHSEGLHAEGRLDVYSPDSVTMSGSDSRNALSDLLRQRLIEQRMDPTTAARVAQADRAHAALRRDTDRRDPRRRRRGVDPAAGACRSSSWCCS